jgi:hypothetical protein
MAKGNQHGDLYPGIVAARYGKIANLADFVRKAQLANYEAFRAMYEGRNAQLFHPDTALITWMSHPAQPSFVWQIYHYDLEPMASYFAVMHASEMVHIQLNEANGQVQVINNKPEALAGLVAHVSVYNLDGSLAYEHETTFTAAPDAATNLGTIDFPANLSPVHFIELSLVDPLHLMVLPPDDPHKSTPPIYSRNFYWRALPDNPDDLTDLDKMPQVTLEAQSLGQKDEDGMRTVTVTLKNPTPNIALMAHVQLRRKSGERVLPVFYSDNYVSLAPDETKTIEIEAADSDFQSVDPLIVVDGWNVTVAPAAFGRVAVAPNLDAQPDHSPVTGLPFATVGLR